MGFASMVVRSGAEMRCLWVLGLERRESEVRKEIYDPSSRFEGNMDTTMKDRDFFLWSRLGASDEIWSGEKRSGEGGTTGECTAAPIGYTI